MKKFIAALVLISSAAFASPDTQLDTECVKYLVDGNHASLQRAVRMCQGQVKKDCVAYMVETHGERPTKAVDRCRQGVNKECVELMRSTRKAMSLSRAVGECRGFVQVDCLNFVMKTFNERATRAASTCRNGVSKSCLEYMFTMTGSKNISRNNCL